jgi:ribonucleoside-diphosphate reductase alpha chain
MLREAAQGDFFVSTACLVGDSIVNTEQGDMTIEDLVTILKSGVSISVLSYNEKTRENEMKSVTWGDVTRKSAKVIEVKLKDGKKLRLTEDHRIYTDKGWMEAGELRLHPGVKILCI